MSSSSSSSSKVEMGGGGDNNNSNNNNNNNKKRAATSTSTSTSVLSPRCSSTTTTTTSYSNKKQKVMSTSAATSITAAAATPTTTTTTASIEQPPIFCWVTQGKTDHYAIIVDPLVLAVLAKERNEQKEEGTSRNTVTRSGTKRTCRAVAAAGNNNNSTSMGQRTELSRVLPVSMTDMEIKWCSTKHKQQVLVSSVKLDVDPGHENTTTSTVLGSPEGREGSSKRPRRSSTLSSAAVTVAASHTPSVLRGGRARGRERQSPVQLLSSKLLTGGDHGDEDGTTTTGVTPSSLRRGSGRPPKQPPLPQTQPALSSINNNGSSNGPGGSGKSGDVMGSGIGVVRGGSNGAPGRGESCGPGEVIEGRTAVSSTGTMERTSSNNDDEEGNDGGGKETTTRTSTTPPSSSLSSLVGVIRRGCEQPGKQSPTHNTNGSTSTGLERRGGDAMMGGTGMGVRMGGSSGELGGPEGRGESRGPGGFVAKDRTTTTSTGTVKNTSTSNHGSSARIGNRDDDHDHDHNTKEKAVLVDEDKIVRTTGNNIHNNDVDHHTKRKAADKTAPQDSYATIAGPGTRGGDNSMGGVGMGAMRGGSSGAPGGPEVRGGSDVPDGFVAKGSTATASTGTMDRTSTSSHGSSTRSGNRDDHDHDHGDDVSEDEYNDDKVHSKEDNEVKLSCEDDADDDRTVAMSPERDASNVTAAGHNTTVTGEGHNNNNNVDDKNTEGKNDKHDDDDDGAAATKKIESTFKSLTTLLSTSILTATATARGVGGEDGEAVHVRVAAFEFHYYVFQLLYMIGFLVHCRKYNDWTGPVTMLHILLFVMTSSVSPDATNVNIHSSGSEKKQTLVFFALSVVIRELLFLTFLGLVIYTMVEQSPQNANHHFVMGFISFCCLVPPQVTRVLTQLHVFLVVVFQSSSSASSPDDTSGSGSSLSQTTTQDGLNRTRIMIVVMYFMAGFHKVNTDFLFNPQVSCAFDMMWNYLPLLKIQDSDDLEEDNLFLIHPLLRYLPFLGLLVELVPPILLSIPHPHVQQMGILMLLSLHLLLLPTGFADFGSIAQSFLWLFIHPLRLCVDHNNNNNNNNTNDNMVLRKSYFNDMAVCLCGLHFCNIIYIYNMTDEEADNAVDNLREEGMVIFAYFVMWSTIFRTPPHTAGIGNGNTNTDVDVDVDVDAGVVARQHRAVRLYLPTSIWSKIGILTFLVYTCNPYLGLKTTGCVTMFSNLRTEDNGSIV